MCTTFPNVYMIIYNNAPSFCKNLHTFTLKTEIRTKYHKLTEKRFYPDFEFDSESTVDCLRDRRAITWFQFVLWGVNL
jgi:hypothetical protein